VKNRENFIVMADNTRSAKGRSQSGSGDRNDERETLAAEGASNAAAEQPEGTGNITEAEGGEELGFVGVGEVEEDNSRAKSNVGEDGKDEGGKKGKERRETEGEGEEEIEVEKVGKRLGRLPLQSGLAEDSEVRGWLGNDVTREWEKIYSQLLGVPKTMLVDVMRRALKEKIGKQYAKNVVVQFLEEMLGKGAVDPEPGAEHGGHRRRKRTNPISLRWLQRQEGCRRQVTAKDPGRM
jgi:hypothetical protein